MQARRLLDQVTILASGEAIVFGSAFHVPTRVQFDRPTPAPYSQTAAPFHEWSKEKDPFPLGEVIEAWGIQQPVLNADVASDMPTRSEAPNTDQAAIDDQTPF